MNDETLRGRVRRLTFLYQDGLVLATTLRALAAVDLARPCLADSLRDARRRLPERGFAHLQIGLRSLAQAGWVEEDPAAASDPPRVEWTADGREILTDIDSYLRAGDFLAGFRDSAADAWSRAWPADSVARFIGLAESASAGWPLAIGSAALRERAVAHLTGALLCPLLLSLRATGRVGEDRPRLDETELGHAQQRLLESAGWTSAEGTWTRMGQVEKAYIAHLGLTASYLPLLSRLPDLYAGAVPALATAPDGREWHVQRELNIQASSAAHGRYFADADEMIARIFDREPIQAQPRFVLDVGCGDGGWIAHVDRLVRDRTLRGRHLASHPLRLVGVDHSSAAIERARAELARSGVEALLVEGDVSEPEALRDRLAAHGLDIADGLHLHAFIDHDRALRGADRDSGASSLDRGIYLGSDGGAVTPADVETDLAAHLRRWAPFVSRHGLVMLEAHRVAPMVAAREQGAMHSIAFDAYHGYSRQYPLERSAFLAAVRRAGLREASSEGRCYPSTRPAVAVSLGRLLSGAEEGLLQAGPAIAETGPDTGGDHEDGRALHHLLYAGGDLRYPRDWSAMPTRALVSQAATFLERRLERASGRVVRVCDYGTGTGLAPIELLKACHERGLDARLEQSGTQLELHLVDLPSSWFAQGRALLGSHPRVSFHALQDDQGRFRPLPDLLGGEKADLLLASMVFHLIPPSALDRVAADMAGALASGGALLWNAPDLAPAADGSVLFHDPNRMLRRLWKNLLGGAPAASPAQAQAVAQAPRAPDGSLLIDDARANRRVLPVANRAEAVAAALSVHFSGEYGGRPHEMKAKEALDAILVPSNQRELLPEIADDALRHEVIAELMDGQVLPTFCRGPAGTGDGFAVHWTAGTHYLR